MYRTMYAIMQYQQEYFKTGDERKLKPMILKTSRIFQDMIFRRYRRRVANSKFVQTEYGTKRLKEFSLNRYKIRKAKKYRRLKSKKSSPIWLPANLSANHCLTKKLKTTLERKGIISPSYHRQIP